MMKYIKAFGIIFALCFIVESINCLLDGSRVVEHNAAGAGLLISFMMLLFMAGNKVK